MTVPTKIDASCMDGCCSNVAWHTLLTHAESGFVMQESECLHAVFWSVTGSWCSYHWSPVALALAICVDSMQLTLLQWQVIIS